jgi:hypothetical protein
VHQPGQAIVLYCNQTGGLAMWENTENTERPDSWEEWEQQVSDNCWRDIKPLLILISGCIVVIVGLLLW